MSLHPHEYEVHAIRSIIQEVYARWEAINSSSPDLPESWRDEFSRFRLWERSMSQQLITNWEGKSLIASQTISDVYKRVIQLLNDLTEYLDDIYNILSGMRQDKSESTNHEEAKARSSEEVEPVSEIAELWLMVKDVVTSLLKAVALARRNGGSYLAQHAIHKTTRISESLDDMTTNVDQLRDDFPELEHKEWLLLRIGKAIAYKQLWLSHSSDRERQVSLDTHGVLEEAEGTMPSMLYFCTFEHCSAGLFSSRTSWANHERMCHRRQWHCPICSEGFDNQEQTAKHISDEHSFGGDNVHDLIYAASPLTLIMRLSDCAFCDDIAAWDLSSSQGASSQSEPSSATSLLVSLETYENHVCKHIHQLASLAIDLAAPTDTGNPTSKKAFFPQMQTGTTTVSSFSPQNPSTSSRTSVRRRPSLSVLTGARHSTNRSPVRAPPNLSQLPSLRDKRPDSDNDTNTPWGTAPTSRGDLEELTSEFTREAARRRRFLDEYISRRDEELEAAEDLQLGREAERVRNLRSFSPLHGLPNSHVQPIPSLENERRPGSRHTSPPVPPRLGRPVQTRAPSASSPPPLAAHTTHRHRSYGPATVHEYRYPDSSAASSRRPSDSIRERGREVIARERAKAATEKLPSRQETSSGKKIITSPRGQPQKSGSNKDEDGSSVQESETNPSVVETRQSTDMDDTILDEARWEPVFDEDDGRISELESEAISEGSARQELRRRRARRYRDDSRRRGERRSDFFF